MPYVHAHCMNATSRSFSSAHGNQSLIASSQLAAVHWPCIASVSQLVCSPLAQQPGVGTQLVSDTITQSCASREPNLCPGVLRRSRPTMTARQAYQRSARTSAGGSWSHR